MNTTKSLYRLAFALLVSLSIFTIPQSVPALAACTVTGEVYRDFNANGTRDVPIEIAAPNITVTAYLPNGAVADTTVSAADGSYTLNVAANVPQVRVEFTGIPDYLRSGPFGGASDTTVTFVECTPVTPTINLGVANPGQYCHTTNPDLATSCFVAGDQQAAGAINQATMVTFPLDAGAVTGTAPYGPGSLYDQPGHPTIATAGETGSVYGLAYQRGSDSYFAASYVKRHAGLGQNAAGQTSTGLIYRVTRAGVVTLLTDLNPVFNTGADPHPGPGATPLDWQIDANAFDSVGKVGLGALDISEDDTTLYTVNLNTRSLITVPIANPAGATAVAIPDPGCVNGAWRPFGLGVRDGLIYIGGVCDAGGVGGTAANLDAYVRAYDPQGGTFTTVLQFGLDYPRGCTSNAPGCAAGRAAEWRPWITAWPVTGGTIIYPQPMLTDIAFDNGDLVIGLRDRLGDQAGNAQRSPNAADATLYSAITAGDILRACANGAGGWTLEADATCGGVTTAGNAGEFIGQGPGNPGGEFYFEDKNALTPPASRHDEISMGSVFIIPGMTDVAVTAFDPVPNDNELFDGGIVWLSNTTGTRTRSYRIYNSSQGGATFFGKANGLGSLEAACGPSPLEIGNRVWEDLDRNGQQDPGEVPLAGVVVSLYDAADVLLANTTTNAEGEYYFNAANVFNAADPRTWDDLDGDGVRDLNEPAGITDNTTYTVRLDNAANYGGGVLSAYYATPNGLVADLRDSDGVVLDFNALVSPANAPEFTLTTGGYGDNNHTYDFGFALIIATNTPPVTSTPPTVTGTPGGSANVVVNKSSNPPFAGPGDTVTWTLTATASGSVPATNVQVVDNLPAELEYISHSATIGSVNVSGQNVTWTIPLLNPGQSATLTITTRIRSSVQPPFQIINVADVSENGVAGTSATAPLLSARRLPATGETPWLAWLALTVLVVGAGIVGVLASRLRAEHTR